MVTLVEESFKRRLRLLSRMVADAFFGNELADSLDLQYLVGISCSNCFVISFRTSFMVTLVEESFKRRLRLLSRMVADAFFGNELAAVK